MNPNPRKVWNTSGYVRLSHEDGDKEESNSVTGQKDLLRDYFGRHPELQECSMRVDDGYSGSSFQRPAFQEMMAEVKAGKINCIVVKDLSRFGRNYLDAGEYIEKIFPFLGVRFIAINDNYDSLHSHAESDELIIPFKNLINEAYCRDSSIKIRSQLEIKRNRGDFIGSFAVFGYLKDPENKNRLLVDEYAADVVRDIFRWKLDGISAGDIADRLNVGGVLSPLDYKKSLGLRFATPFRVNAQSQWFAVSVLRVLKNPIYIGVLTQGKNTTPSYKVHKRVAKPCEEWAVVADSHEPIVDRYDFESVQKVLALDTRTSPGSGTVACFSGLVYCGECGAPMIRKTVPAGKKKYIYYVCAAHKTEKNCSSHSLRDSVLEEIVLESIKRHIQDVINLSDLLQLIDTALLEQTAIRKLQGRLDKKQEESDQYQRLLCSLYENLNEGVLDRVEYEDLKKTYSARRVEAEVQTEAIRAEMKLALESHRGGHGWMEQFRKHQNIDQLDRAILVSLVEHILVFNDQRVEIVYRWHNAFHWQTNMLLHVQALPQKETV